MQFGSKRRWGALLGGGVAVVLLYSWWARNSRVEIPSGSISIEARGIDREWRFTFPGADGLLHTADDYVSTSELKVPIGSEVIIQLRSDDYIYVFACPDLELREIAIPDLEYSVELHADHLGDHGLVMDPMCGFSLPPGETMGKLSIVSQSAFRSWLKEIR